mgnify:CR=1 FL=1|jgi:hypothetical protein
MHKYAYRPNKEEIETSKENAEFVIFEMEENLDIQGVNYYLNHK